MKGNKINKLALASECFLTFAASVLLLRRAFCFCGERFAFAASVLLLTRAFCFCGERFAFDARLLLLT